MESLDNATVAAAAGPPQFVNDAISYFNIMAIALYCVFDGSSRSVNFMIEKQKSGNAAEVLSTKDVAIFPLMASATLLSIYVVFRVLSKEYTNMLLSFYFLLIGTAALFQAVRSFFHRLWPDYGRISSENRYQLALYKINVVDRKREKEAIERWSFDTKDLLTLSACITFSIWYFLKKHWIANDVIAAALSIEAIKMLHLDRFTNAVLLFCGLFVYDVFWVFGTNVMVSVAKNLRAPIMILWPNNIFRLDVWKGTAADVQYALLGLGDIIVPGIFAAFLKRFDHKRDTDANKQHRSYYQLCFVSYSLALVCTVLVMKVFKHAQPALLYIVPFCMLSCVAQALVRGDLASLLAYRDAPEKKTE